MSKSTFLSSNSFYSSEDTSDFALTDDKIEGKTTILSSSNSDALQLTDLQFEERHESNKKQLSKSQFWTGKFIFVLTSVVIIFLLLFAIGICIAIIVYLVRHRNFSFRVPSDFLNNQYLETICLQRNLTENPICGAFLTDDPNIEKFEESSNQMDEVNVQIAEEGDSIYSCTGTCICEESDNDVERRDIYLVLAGINIVATMAIVALSEFTNEKNAANLCQIKPRENLLCRIDNADCENIGRVRMTYHCTGLCIPSAGMSLIEQKEMNVDGFFRGDLYEEVRDYAIKNLNEKCSRLLLDLDPNSMFCHY